MRNDKNTKMQEDIKKVKNPVREAEKKCFFRKNS